MTYINPRQAASGENADDGDYVIVIPTLGRASLRSCLRSLDESGGPPPRQLVVVDDRIEPTTPLPLWAAGRLAERCLVVETGGRGPAAARNAGWRAATATTWVVFLDDDVIVARDWRAALVTDVVSDSPRVGGVQGVIEVPLPRGRRPTDLERDTAGLRDARWITADMAYRRIALLDAGGFDERFSRAYREDTDMALRLLDAGWRLRRGARHTSHPVRPADPWASVRAQAGNADDALMDRLHGRRWRAVAGASTRRRSGHLISSCLAVTALLATATGKRRIAAGAAVGWLAATAEFAAARIRPGPRTAHESGLMLATSVVIPPVAVWHWLRGGWAARHVDPWPPRPAAVLLDRDDTLVRDVPYNADPSRVEPMPGVVAALARLRAAGLALGVITNQSGIGRGLLTERQMLAVNARIEHLLGDFDTWAICRHAPEGGCECRKPADGLIRQAAARLGVAPAECVVIGDIGTDVEAARAAGARAILVPTPRTRPGERRGVPTAPDLGTAVAAILGEARLSSWSWPTDSRPTIAARVTRAPRVGRRRRPTAQPAAIVPCGGRPR